MPLLLIRRPKRLNDKLFYHKFIFLIKMSNTGEVQTDADEIRRKRLARLGGGGSGSTATQSRKPVAPTPSSSHSPILDRKPLPALEESVFMAARKPNQKVTSPMPVQVGFGTNRSNKPSNPLQALRPHNLLLKYWLQSLMKIGNVLSANPHFL